MSTLLQNGIAAASGPALATCAPLLHGGSVWYVDSVTGADHAAPAGLDRSLPLATLQQAVNNADPGDIVVLLATHAETISTVVNISFGLDIVGEGVDANGDPTATLTHVAGSSHMFNVTAFRSSIQGVRFAEPASASTGNYVLFTPAAAHAQFALIDCYVPMNGSNTAYGVRVNDTSYPGILDIAGCRFVSTATSSAARPRPAVLTGSIDDGKTTILDSEFDGGTVGFATSGLAANLEGSWALYTGVSATILRVSGTRFLNGADVGVWQSVCGYIADNVGTSSIRVVRLVGA